MSAKPRTKAAMSAETVARMLAAQDQDQDQGPETAPAPEPVAEAPVAPAPFAFDPGKVDGRTLRRTGREPFATRIKPETHESLRRIAYGRGITIAEALELAVAAYERS